MKNALALLALLAGHGPALACDGLRVEGGWIRLPPPGVPMTAGYAQLRNTSDTALTIDALSSPQWGDVTLHRTLDEHGVSRMRSALPLVIDARVTHALEPGGYHLMLSRPGAEPAPGQRVTIEFRCEESSMEGAFAVRAGAP